MRVATINNPPLKHQIGTGIRFPTMSQDDVHKVQNYARIMLGAGHSIEKILPSHDVPVRIKMPHGQTGSGSISSLWKMMMPHAKKAGTVIAKVATSAAKNDTVKKVAGTAAAAAGTAVGAALINKLTSGDEMSKKDGEALINKALSDGQKYKVDRRGALKGGINNARQIVDNDVRNVQRGFASKMDSGQRRAANMRVKTQGTVSQGSRELGERANARMRGVGFRVGGFSNTDPDKALVLAYSGSSIRFANSEPARSNIRFAQGVEPNVLQYGSYYGSGNGHFRDNIGSTLINSGKLLKKAANFTADVGSYAVNRMVDKDYKPKGSGMYPTGHNVSHEKKMLKFQTIYDEVVKRIGHDHSTSNEELERVGIQTIGDKFLGVFASDTFPRATRHETYCIVNLDDSNGAGTHWVARMTKKKDNYWYDSFARSISTIMPRARGVDTDLSPNEHDQHMSQMDCGQRCLAALLCGHRFGIELFKRL